MIWESMAVPMVRFQALEQMARFARRRRPGRLSRKGNGRGRLTRGR